MEPVIINNTSYSAELLNICNKPDVLILRVKYALFSFMYLVILSVWGAELFLDPGFSAVFWTAVSLGGAAASLYGLFTAKQRLLKQSILRMLSSNNGFVSTRLLFYPNEIVSEASNGTRHVTPCGRIRKISLDDGYYLLRLDKTTILPVDQSGFEKGDAARFETYLCSAAPAARWIID